MSDWQPIETAPRDGTVVMAHDGKWQSITDWCDKRGAWLNYDDRPWQPIEWRPLLGLPAPPSEGEPDA